MTAHLDLLVRAGHLPTADPLQVEDVVAEAEDGQNVSDAQDVDKAAALEQSTGAAPASLESSPPVGNPCPFDPPSTSLHRVPSMTRSGVVSSLCHPAPLSQAC